MLYVYKEIDQIKNRTFLPYMSVGCPTLIFQHFINELRSPVEVDIYSTLQPLSSESQCCKPITILSLFPAKMFRWALHYLLSPVQTFMAKIWNAMLPKHPHSYRIQILRSSPETAVLQLFYGTGTHSSHHTLIYIYNFHFLLRTIIYIKHTWFSNLLGLCFV